MKRQHIHYLRRTLALAAICAALGGCMTSTPIWDAHFGEALRAVTASQVIDPQAAERNPSKPGVDGTAAVSAMRTYDKSFVAPARTANPFVIGIGTGSSGQ